MKDLSYYLDKTGEIGYVEEVVHSIVFVSGLPQVHPYELVMFESGELGQVLSMNDTEVEVLVLSRFSVKVGSRVVRTGESLQISVGNELLGRVIDPLGRVKDNLKPIKTNEVRKIEVEPLGILKRKPIEKPFETGVTIVDMVVPLAKGQRELIIGDRKTGKTNFLLQSIMTQAKLGTICIYAVVGQRNFEIKKLDQFVKQKGIKNRVIIVASSSSDPSGLIFLTPYSAMTIAEHFRDQGLDVLLVLDDLTSQARYYREVSLLAKRFPGRNSFPGDIFYVQARLLERAGNFTKGSITCFPLAETVLGDLSGYLQTNLMSMTDGHVFFDIDLYNQGKRPAVSPFLSVTRVGHQVQTALEKDMSRELSSFLVEYEKMKQFTHFGAEVGESLKKTLDLGAKLDVLLNQENDKVISVNLDLILLAGLWAGIWTEANMNSMKRQMEQIILDYQTDPNFKKQVDTMISASKSLVNLLDLIRKNDSIFSKRFPVATKQ